MGSKRRKSEIWKERNWKYEGRRKKLVVKGNSDGKVEKLKITDFTNIR